MNALARRDLLRFFLAVSFAAHLLAFLAMAFLPGFSFLARKVHLPQAVRVDMVGLPELQPRAGARPKAAPAPAKKKVLPLKQKPKPPKKKQVKKKPDPKKKTPQKKESKEQTKKAQAQALAGLRGDEGASKPSYKGERISKGDSAIGEETSLLMYSYFARVRGHIKMFWNLPRHLADKNLSAVLIVEVNSQGAVTRIALENTSGSEAFDQIVIEAIREASPFPEPPEELISILKQGVGLKFP